jgi:zinc/manganese transport system substrate-binding protein
MRSTMALTVLAFSAVLSAGARGGPLQVVSSEDVYGDVAAQIGGSNVAVTSVLARDGKLSDSKTLGALASAKIVILNGANYDSWMEKLLKSGDVAGRKEIIVGRIVGRDASDNPHFWGDPAYVKSFATALATAFIVVDPAHKSEYAKRQAAFSASLQPLEAKIAEMRGKYEGLAVAASAPLFGYQAALIGLKLRNEQFAWAVMNNSEPSAAEVAAFEDDLRTHKIKAVILDVEAVEPAVRRMIDVAGGNSVPIIEVSESQPPNSSYQAWMLAELNALDKALSAEAR